MKTTASNGTILEIGKKYRIKGLLGIEYVEILDIGYDEAWTVNTNSGKYSYKINQDWLSYEEPLPKPFEGYQKWYCIHNGIRIVYAEIRPVMIVGSCLTESEIIELGLKI